MKFSNDVKFGLAFENLQIVSDLPDLYCYKIFGI